MDSVESKRIFVISPASQNGNHRGRGGSLSRKSQCQQRACGVARGESSLVTTFSHCNSVHSQKQASTKQTSRATTDTTRRLANDTCSRISQQKKLSGDIQKYLLILVSKGSHVAMDRSSCIATPVYTPCRYRLWNPFYKAPKVPSEQSFKEEGKGQWRCKDRFHKENRRADNL